MLSLARFIKQFGADHVVYPVMGKGGSAAVFGHWLWCRKCKQPVRNSEESDSSDNVVIHVPEKSVDQCLWVEVLAKGVKVGKRRIEGRADRRRKRLRKVYLDSVKVGSLLLCPAMHPWGIKHSPFNEHEFLIDETVPEAVWEG